MARPRKVTSLQSSKKIVHEIELINSRALIALKGYLDYPVDDDAHAAMFKLFKDYKDHKEALRIALKSAFRFITKERYETYPDDPPCKIVPPEKPSKDKINEAKKYINQLAKKFWKK